MNCTFGEFPTIRHNELRDIDWRNAVGSVAQCDHWPVASAKPFLAKKNFLRFLLELYPHWNVYMYRQLPTFMTCDITSVPISIISTSDGVLACVSELRTRIAPYLNRLAMSDVTGLRLSTVHTDIGHITCNWPQKFDRKTKNEFGQRESEEREREREWERERLGGWTFYICIQDVVRPQNLLRFGGLEFTIYWFKDSPTGTKPWLNTLSPGLREIIKDPFGEEFEDRLEKFEQKVDQKYLFKRYVRIRRERKRTSFFFLKANRTNFRKLRNCSRLQGVVFP